MAATRVIAIALVALLCGTAAADDLTVMTKQGPMKGITAEKANVREWLGVPFATPPVGDLRWKAPQPPTPWQGTYQAWDYGAACYQHNDTFTVLNKVSEDCLYLNVYAPPVDAMTNDTLPVMLFFYGGSWAEGAASFFLYDGIFDVDYVKDVIIVTANYRLASFGFLGSALLQAEDNHGSTGNQGLLDQRMAMKWVQENAAAFGGDPQRVMIFGESAGAGSVSAHLTMPNSWPYFQRAGMESGPISDWTAQPLYAQQEKFDLMSKHLNCDTAKDVLACMRAVDSETAYQAAKNLPSALMKLLQWSPTVDGVEIVDDPRTLLKEGKLANVPILLGTNADEGTIFSRWADHDANTTTLMHYLLEIYGPDAQEIMEKYPLSDYSGQHPDNTAWWTLTHIFGDSQMSCPARATARAHAAAGNNAYLYFYTHELEIIELFEKFLGVCHGSELPMVFKQDAVLLAKGAHGLAEQFVQYWTHFAATGNPNSAASPVTWKAYSASNDFNIQLNIPVSGQTGLKSTLCDFWDDHQLTYERMWGPPPSAN